MLDCHCAGEPYWRVRTTPHQHHWAYSIQPKPSCVCVFECVCAVMCLRKNMEYTVCSGHCYVEQAFLVRSEDVPFKPVS